MSDLWQKSSDYVTLHWYCCTPHVVYIYSLPVASRRISVLHKCVLSGAGIAFVSGSVSDGTLAVCFLTFSCNAVLWECLALYRSTSSGALEKKSADARPCCSTCANNTLTRYRSQVLKARVLCSRANEMYRFCRKETAGFQHILYRTNQFDFLTSLGTFMASNTSATEGAAWPGCAASPACCDVLQTPSNPWCNCKQQCCDHSSSACNDCLPASDHMHCPYIKSTDNVQLPPSQVYMTITLQDVVWVSSL